MMQVSASWNCVPNQSFVSRGVRSRLQEEEHLTVSKIETIPLLSPTTESEIFQEAWNLPSARIKSPKHEYPREMPSWEENFQDLSDWCMDTFQGQCDFHIGESSSFKLSGTKYEGNDVSTSEEGVSKIIMAVAEDKGGLHMNINNAAEFPIGNSSSVLLSSEPDIKYKKDSTAVTASLPDFWLDLPKASPVAESKPAWIKQDATDVSAPFHPEYHVDDLDLDDACPTSFDSSESQRETWDVLHSIETSGADAFDLLSYVCDDEVRSPDGSSSVDSSTVGEKSGSFMASSSTVLNANKSEKRNGRLERRTTSAATLMQSSLVVPRRSERSRTTTSNVEKVGKNKDSNERRGRKRLLESDSEDDGSSTYRETREKNNEASRRSRLNKKAKESEMALKAVQLEKDNRILKMKVEELEKLVTSMRSALLRSALKKEV